MINTYFIFNYYYSIFNCEFGKIKITILTLIILILFKFLRYWFGQIILSPINKFSNFYIWHSPSSLSTCYPNGYLFPFILLKALQHSFTHKISLVPDDGWSNHMKHWIDKKTLHSSFPEIFNNNMKNCGSLLSHIYDSNCLPHTPWQACHRYP